MSEQPLQMPTQIPRPRIRVKRWIREGIWTIVLSLVVVVLLRTFVFEMAEVDGKSMNPTLEHEQHVLVMKWTQYLRPMPKRGEIMVTQYPNEGTVKYYIKRVVAIGGDEIEVVDGLAYVNGVPNTAGEGLCRYDVPKQEVPAHCVYVMGDNRADSLDSTRIGPLDINLLLGRADAVIYPFSQMKGLQHDED